MTDAGTVTPTRRRVLIGLFLVLVVGAGFLNRVTRQERAAVASSDRSTTASVELSTRAFSTAWYCPGPLPIGHAGEEASVAITNLSGATRTAQLTVAARGLMARSERVRVRPSGEQVVALPRAKHPTFGAVSLIVDGTGVGVTESVAGPTGTVASACTTRVSARAYFGLGSTKGFSNMAISIYNPGATPAVASVAFATPSGLVTPTALASMPVEPEQDLVFYAGRYLPQRAAVSAQVTTVSGRVAVGSLDERPVGPTLHASLALGTPDARSSWWFGPAIVGQGTEVRFGLVNVTGRPVRVQLTSDGGRGAGTETIGLGAYAARQYVLRAASSPRVEAAWLRVLGPGTIVAERSILVSGALTLSTLRPAAELPATLPVGFGVTEPLENASKQWLVTGCSDHTGSEVVALENPGSLPARANLFALLGGRRRLLRSVVVGPGTAATVNLYRFVKDRPALSLLVSANRPVLAGVTQYGITDSGLSLPAPLPVH